MKPHFRTISTFLFIIAILFTNTLTVFASGEGGGHLLEMDVNGYHVTLSSQNDWMKGENTVVVTLADSMDMPVRDADVEILIAQKSSEHAETETDTHVTEQQNSMPGMDMGAPAEETPVHEEETKNPLPMMESDELGMYMVETHLDASGEQDVHVFFHVNGEMLQADFVVNVSGTSSKTIILWGFVTVNAGLVASAGVLKKQSIAVKGGK